MCNVVHSFVSKLFYFNFSSVGVTDLPKLLSVIECSSTMDCTYNKLNAQCHVLHVNSVKHVIHDIVTKQTCKLDHCQECMCYLAYV